MVGALRCGGSDLGRAGSKGLGFASMSNHSPHTSFQTTPSESWGGTSGSPPRPPSPPPGQRGHTSLLSPLPGTEGLGKYPSE